MKTFLILAVVICAASAQLLTPFSWWGKQNPKEGACSSAADCEADECCVHSPFTRRFLLGDDLFGGFADHFNKMHDHFSSLMTGYCKPLKKEGEFCVPFGKEMSIFNTKAHFASCPCADDMYCASDKKVTQHETFGHMETHTNAICAKPEVEGSGEEME